MGADGRRGYFLGSIGKAFKSITKPIKKVLKSPLGKLALAAGLGYYGGPKGWFGKGIQEQGWKKFIASKLPWAAKQTLGGRPALP